MAIPDITAGRSDSQSEEDRARTIVLDLLTGQARSRADLATRLAKRGISAQVAGTVLDRLEAVGLVDDATFAEQWVESRRRTRGLARRALAHELRRQGIDQEVGAAALDQVSAEDEETQARALVERKMRSLAKVERPVAYRRLMGMLARKGYGGELAGRVVREALEVTDDMG